MNFGENNMIKQAFIIIIVTFLLIQPINAQTWTATKRLTWNSGDSFLPAIAVDSNNHIHVAWVDYTSGNYEIYYKKSTDGGSFWTTKRLTYNSGYSDRPIIAVDSNDHIHMVWHDTSSGVTKVYYKKSLDGGASWTTQRLAWAPGWAGYPKISIGSNDHIHVVWHSNTSGNYEIYYKKSTDGGGSWTAKRLTWNPGISTVSAIATNSNNHIHVVWDDNTPGNYEVYFKKSTNGGTSWTTKRLTDSPSSSKVPAISSDSNNNIHVVWHDYTPGNAEIYYNKSTDGGTTWTMKRLTYNSGHSTNAAIAIDSNNDIHVVWEDETPGNKEIYYKKGIQ